MTVEHVLNDTFTTTPAPAVAALEEKNHSTLAPVRISSGMYENGHVIPTDEELANLPKVAGAMRGVLTCFAHCKFESEFSEKKFKLLQCSYFLQPANACAREFAERASYYGCKQVFKNFIRAPLPVGGNGAGAPPRGSQKSAGALGQGTVVASALTDSFTFLAYALPILGGWLADAKFGRFNTICAGIAICGVAHVIMIISAVPSVIQAGHAIGPFALSLYMLAIGAALFKPNIAPTVLDQNPHTKPHVITRKNGSKAVVDPEATSESIMLWFYLLINIGAFLGVATSYLAKYVGFWASYTIPTVLYLLAPFVLWVANGKLIKMAPGGSALGDFIGVNTLAMRYAGLRGFGRKGYWDRVKPSVMAANGDSRKVRWDDQFVDDVRRTMGACAIFAFIPIAQINDGGLGAAANAQSASLTSDGVPNDVLDNFNPLVIILLIPIMNHGVYPLLRKMGIRFGPIKRMTFGFLIAAIGASSYAVIQYYIYQTSPCGYSASTCDIDTGVSPISLWVYAVPTAVTACSEVFINVSAYGIAYSRAPKNMKGFVMSLNLFTTAISTAISLATANAIQDPYLIWCFAVPSIIGFVAAIVFYWLFRDLDSEDFFVSAEDQVITSRSSEDESESNYGIEKTVDVRETKL